MDNISALNNFFIPFRLFGLHSFSLKSLEKKNSGKYPSLVYSLYLASLLALVAFVIVAIHIVLQPYDKEKFSDNKLSGVLKLMISINSFAILFVSFFTNYFKHKSFLQFFKTANKICDLSSREFGVIVTFEKLNRRFAVLFTCFVLFAGFIMTGIALFLPGKLKIHLLVIIPLSFLYLSVLKYHFFVIIVNFFLGMLNSLVGETAKSFTGLRSNVKFEVQQKGNRVRVYSWNDPKNKISSLRKIYGWIRTMADCVNETMGLLVLLVILSSVTTLMRHGYQGFMVLVGKDSLSELAALVHGVVADLAIILVIFIPCQKSESMVTDIIDALDDLDLESVETERLCVDTNEALTRFMLQLSLHPVQFTTAGFYTLNFGLLASIVTGIISYQIILIQFARV